MRYDHFSMLPTRAFQKVCGRMTLEGGGGKGDSPDAPDYSQMAAASEHAANLGKELGDAQLAEAKRQYELNMEVAKPVVDAQLGLMNQTKTQGDDYYNYMVANQRPVEAALNAEAMASGTEAQQNEYASRAQADTLNGYTRALNIAARQGMRYGYSPAKIASTAGSQASGMASSLAQSANAGRQQSKDLGWARKMDTAGLYRNLTGASQGAYGLAINSGNAAMGNQAAPGAGLMNGMAQGAGMQQQGAGQQLSGLGNIMNSQTSMYNNGGATDNTGSLIGALGGIGAAWIKS